MKLGTYVVVLHDPLRYGLGEITNITHDGKVGVTFEPHNMPRFTSYYAPHQIEDAQVYADAQRGALDDLDLMELSGQVTPDPPAEEVV